MVIAQFVKIGLNWSIFNKLNPENHLDFDINHPGQFLETDGLAGSNERTLLFGICVFIPFWTTFPQDEIGRRMAKWVLAITIMQIVLIALIIPKEHWHEVPTLFNEFIKENR
ncbi:MAG: hypothetical protein ACI8V8_001579 [Chitinophagales bacterium]|jgi:hypothetical protein